MATDGLIGVAPPGERRAVPFRGNLLAAIVATVASVAIVAITWWNLWSFDQSLHIPSTSLAIVRVFEVALAAAVLVVPVYAVRALVESITARRLAADGDRHSAAMVLADSRDHIQVVIGLGLTALVVAFLAYFLSENDGKVRSVMFDGDLMWRGRKALLKGFWYTVKMFMVAEAIVLVWALVIAVVRMLPGKACKPIRLLAIVYSDVFRGIPALVTIYLVVFGFQLANVEPFSSLDGTTRLFWLVVFSLVLVYGAYVSEVYRAGLESVHWSQTAAARSLGLSQWQTLRYVVIPQAVRRILPPLTNDFVALQKDTSLAFVVGALDLMGQASLLKSKYFNMSPVSSAALIYLTFTIPFTRLTDYLIDREKKRTSAK